MCLADNIHDQFHLVLYGDGDRGRGNVGDFAIRYGYQRFEGELMSFTIIIMIILVQSIQFGGNLASRLLDKRKV